MNNIEKEDAMYVSNTECIDWKSLEGKRVFITGGTGLIGQILVRSIIYYNAHADLPVKVLLLVRDKEKPKKLFEESVNQNWFEIITGDINSPFFYEGEVHYIIHGASITSSSAFVEKPVETIITAIVGSRNILEFAKNKKIDSMVYLSSMEVYGRPVDNNSLSETNIGILDPLAVRSSYSESKRMVENLCVAYWKQYNVPVKIIRLTQTIGPGISKQDNRVFAYFAHCIIDGDNITLQTKGRTRRMYLYSADAASAILTVLTRGENAKAYNAANKNTFISIKEMADLVVQKFGGGSSKVIVADRTEDIQKFNPEMDIFLDVSKLELLGWQPTIGLEEMYSRMIEAMRTCQ